MAYDLGTDFDAALPFELRPVPRVRQVGADEFRRMARRPAVPVVVEDAMAGWNALEAWRDPERLVYGALVAAKYLQLRAQFHLATSSLPEPEIKLGPTGYTNAQGF